MEIKINLDFSVEKLVYVSLGVLFIYLLTTLTIESIWPDEAFYLWGAQNLFAPVGLHAVTSTQTFLFMFLLFFLRSKLLVYVFYIIGLFYMYKLGKEIKNEWLGLISMLILSTIPTFLFISSRLLVDTPLTTMFIITSYYFLKFEDKRNKENALKLSIAISLTILTKSVGMFVFPIIFIYYVIRYKWRVFKLLNNKGIRYLIIYTLPILLFTIIMLFNVMSFQSSAIKGSIFKGDISYYFVTLPSMVSLYFLPIVFLGLLFGIINVKNKKYSFLLTWFLVYFLIFSFLIGEKVPRYILPALPPLIILSSTAFVFMFKDKKIQMLFVFYLLFIVLFNFIQANSLIWSRANSYTGFKETGEYMRSINANLADIVYCGSTRAMRLFSSIEYKDFGGKMETIPKNKTTFEGSIINKTVFLEVDAWEYTQPSWIYPLNQTKFDYLVSLGFRPVFRSDNYAVYLFFKS